MNPDVLAYERIHAFLGNWLWKLIVFAFISLSLWHAAHRLRITAHDFGIGSDIPIAVVCYAAAMLLAVATVVFLFSV